MGSDGLEKLITVLARVEKTGIQGRAVVGFDGFVDRISRVVKVRDTTERFVPFETITEFGNRILEAAGKSCDLEYVTELEKLGGNSPIMAHALATLGIETTLIGAVGYPEVYPVFRHLHPECRLIPISSPSFCTAYEFLDGKVMLADLKVLNEVNWDLLCQRIALEELRTIYRQSQLVGFLNWSQLAEVETIWQGILREIVENPGFPCSRDRFLFVDLADLSKKTPSDVRRAFDVLGGFTRAYQVYLGLNENETRLIYRALFREEIGSRSLVTCARAIWSEMAIDGLVVHLINDCFLVSRHGILRGRGESIERPKLLTGGGDNFNAGFCLGLLLGEPEGGCLVLGMYTAGFYVREGRSATLPELIDELKRASFGRLWGEMNIE